MAAAVDLLHHAKAPALHLRASHEHALANGCIKWHGEIRYVTRVAEVVDVGAEQAVEGAAEASRRWLAELVVILTILAEQGGRAKRAEPRPVHRTPSLPPERLHVPGVGLRAC